MRARTRLGVNGEGGRGEGEEAQAAAMKEQNIRSTHEYPTAPAGHNGIIDRSVGTRPFIY